MKTKIFTAATLAIAMCAAWFVGTNVNKSEKEITLEENAEALADEESSGSDCGGYRDWAISGDGSKREFYDCQCVLRAGYDPSGNCN